MTEKVDIVIGCDEAAVAMKDALKAHLRSLGHNVVDLGIDEGESCLYPDIAHALAMSIKEGNQKLGVLCCGTGIGMAITANKVKGIRAAQAHDTYSAKKARMSNNAQIVSIGARVVGLELAKTVVDAFIQADFSGGSSSEKVNRIHHYENLNSGQ